MKASLSVCLGHVALCHSVLTGGVVTFWVHFAATQTWAPFSASFTSSIQGCEGGRGRNKPGVQIHLKPHGELSVFSVRPMFSCCPCYRGDAWLCADSVWFRLWGQAHPYPSNHCHGMTAVIPSEAITVTRSSHWLSSERTQSCPFHLLLLQAQHPLLSRCFLLPQNSVSP